MKVALGKLRSGNRGGKGGPGFVAGTALERRRIVENHDAVLVDSDVVLEHLDQEDGSVGEGALRHVTVKRRPLVQQDALRAGDARLKDGGERRQQQAALQLVAGPREKLQTAAVHHVRGVGDLRENGPLARIAHTKCPRQELTVTRSWPG